MFHYNHLFFVGILMLYSSYVINSEPNVEIIRSKNEIDFNRELTLNKDATQTQQQCPGENYSPCSCYRWSNGGYEIVCEFVPLDEVKAVFNASHKADLYYVAIDTLESDIPDDILSGKTTESIVLTGQKQALNCNPGAFSSTKDVTTLISITSWDVRRTDFAFLAGFNSVTQFYFFDVDGFLDIWAALPPLGSVSYFGLFNTMSPGANISPCYQFVNGVQTILLRNNSLGDSSMSLLLECFLGTSKSTADSIEFTDNKLTAMPPQMALFTKLNYVDASNNVMSRISSGSLNFAFGIGGSRGVLRLLNCQIEEIEPGAFVGDYGNVVVDLTGNRLTRFDSAVFYETVNQMSFRHLGFIDIMSNPFDCESDICHLKWLVVDNRPLLGRTVRNGACSNGTAFERLDHAAIEAACCRFAVDL